VRALPRVSEEHVEARKQQIIDAAYRCFARKGFHQATMRDIYEEAKLSPGAVYHYFASKDDIIRASFDFDYERSTDLFRAAQESDDPLAALSRLFDFFAVGLESAAQLGAGRVNVQGWGEALVNPRVAETFVRVLGSYQEVLSQVVQKGQATGQISNSFDPLAVAQVLLSLYYGLELQKAINPDLDVGNYATAVKILLRAGLQQA
jgi:AcrR family transcriptional regulator